MNEWVKLNERFKPGTYNIKKRNGQIMRTKPWNRGGQLPLGYINGRAIDGSTNKEVNKINEEDKHEQQQCESGRIQHTSKIPKSA